MTPLLSSFVSATLAAGPAWTPEEIGTATAALLAVAILVGFVLPRLRDIPADQRAKRFPDHKTLDPVQVEEMVGGLPPLIVDLRSPEAFKGRLGHIRAALNIPYRDLDRRIGELRGSSENRPIVLVDDNDELSHQAVGKLVKKDFAWVYVLKGGMKAWVAHRLPVYR